MKHDTCQTRALPPNPPLFHLPQNPSATELAISAEARTHQNQHFFSTLLDPYIIKPGTPADAASGVSGRRHESADFGGEKSGEFDRRRVFALRPDDLQADRQSLPG